MKILMEKPTPSIPSNNNNATSCNPDILDMLSACLFTDVMSATETDDSSSSAPYDEDIEKSQISADTATSPVTVTTIDTMQKMIEDMLQQASSYQSQQATTLDQEQAKTAAQATQARTNEPNQSATLNQQHINNLDEQLTSNQAANEDILKIANNDNKAMPKFDTDHQQDEKLTAIPKKLTPAEKAPASKEINQTMNALATNTLHAEHTSPKTQTIQIESQGKVLKKTLENWANSINATIDAEPVVTTPPQTPNSVRDFSGILNTREAAVPAKAEAQSLTMQLDHIEASAAQPGMFHVKLKVNPAELGPIHASIKINNNSVEIQIMTNNNHTEQVVKAHLSALTAQFSESSMQLSTVVVQQQSLSNSGQDQQSSQQSPEHLDEQVRHPSASHSQPDDKKETKTNKLVDAYI